MHKLCIFAGTMIGGYGFWYLGTLFGMDSLSMGNFFLSGVGSILGVYAGWKVAERYK